MRHKTVPAFLLAALFVFMLVPGFAFAAPAKGETVINIYHTNDVHGHAVGNESSIGYARFQTMLKNDSSDGRLIFDAGDVFSGSAFANLSDGESISAVMEQAGYNAFTPGDHDFDYGSDTLSGLVEGSGAHGLAINISKDGQPFFEPYRIFEKSGIKIGVIGVATPDIEKTSDPRDIEGLSFLDGQALLASVQGAVNELRSQNVNAVVALSSLGTSESASVSSIDLATGVSGIDLIIDGHSHDAYPGGFTTYPGYVQGRTPMIVQAGKYFEEFGIASLTFDSKKMLTGITERLVDAAEASAFSPDKGISETIIEYEKEQQPTMERSVAVSPVFLNASPAYLLTGVTNFGRLTARAMLGSTGADAAVISSGNITASIPAGTVTFGDLFNSIPFDNYIVTVEMTGAELKELLNEHMVMGDSAFPQFAGVEVVAQKYLTESGESAAVVQTMKRNGQEIADTDTLTVATLDSMYYGGDGYTFSSPIVKEGPTIFDAVSEYLRQTPEEELEAPGGTADLAIWEETIDADGIIAKLNADVPDDVYVYLNQPSIVPESVIYPLVGQDRNLIFSINDKRPYSFVFNGEALSVPMNISLDAAVSQKAPQGKRTASSADKDAVFLDLSRNELLPQDTLMTIHVGDVYAPGSLVYLYYYDVNRDILPLDEKGIPVDENGNITFPVAGGETYLINSNLLNAATIFDTPTADQPFTLGIIILVAAFAAWSVFFIITKKGAQKNSGKQQ